jgi:hypothetical protein
MSKGGKRKGAGRKPALYKTKTISIRVDIAYADKFKNYMKYKLEAIKCNIKDFIMLDYENFDN